jgi:hypothetical protein
MNRVRSDHNLDLWPGIYSFDPKTIRENAGLGDELSEAIPVDIQDDGSVGPTGVPGNFLGLRTVGGYEISDLSLPMVSNDRNRHEIGLADGPVSSRHADILKKLGKLMFGQWTPATSKIAKISSTGFPDHQKDPDFKIKLFYYVMDNFDKILDIVATGDFERLYQDYDLILAYNLVQRAQVDKVKKEGDRFTSKDRPYATYEFAASSGARGALLTADKTVTIDGVDYPGHFAMRIRIAYGLAAGLNYAMTAFMSGCRAIYLKKYEYTWKHRTVESMEQKLNKWDHIFATDAPNYDTSFGDWLNLALIDACCFDDRMKILMKHALHAPYYSGPTAKGEKGGIWMGNPFDVDQFKLKYGLPSGVAFNPDAGKFGMTYQYLCIFDDFFHDTLEKMETVLQGDHPEYGMLNMGDDTVGGTNNARFNTHVNENLATDDQVKARKFAPYFVLEPETPYVFLGNAIVKRPTGGVKLYPSIPSFFLNWLVPERGVSNKMRMYWPIGWKERKLHYAKAPAFSKAWEIFERRHYDAYGISPDTIATMHEENVRNLNTFNWTDIDREVMENPSKLYYKYSEEDISVEVLDLLTTSIPSEDVERLVYPFITQGVH